MIILPRKKLAKLQKTGLAIITPPKNASTSLHSVLCNSRIGGIYVIGPMQGPEPIQIESHVTIIPSRYLVGDLEERCRPVIVVRDPYERALSLWRHCIRGGDYPNDYTGDFAGFIRSELISKPGWWHWPNWKYLQECNGYQRLDVDTPIIFRVKTIREDLIYIGALPAGYEIPVDNAFPESEKHSWSYEERGLVNRWAGHDFLIFGFTRIGEMNREEIEVNQAANQRWLKH